MVLSRDALTFEDGFHWLISRDLRPHVGDFVALLSIHTDTYTRGKLIELLGHTASLEAIPVLVQELAHPNSRIREWAVLSLEELPFGEPRQLADRYKREHPEEW